MNYRSIGLDGEAWPTWVRELKGKSGVYVIRAHGSDGKALYVGSSAGKLYDTLTRHFQSWRRIKNFWKGLKGAHHDPGMTYSRSHCAVGIEFTSKGEHFEREGELIRSLKPRDNLVTKPEGEDAPF